MADSQIPIRLMHLEKSYQGQSKVLDGVDLTLQPGTITGLLGRNGSGKTTLIRAALGLIKPDIGVPLLFGEDAWKASASTRQRVGYVGQKFDDMFWLTVSEALNLVGSFYPNWDHELVNRLQTQWEVPGSQKIQQLSLGQQQKVSILLAIGHLPELLVLDEPVASLDPVARQEFLRALLMLNDQYGQTILLSSHITTDIERIAADVAVLHQGRITYHGGLDQLKETVRCLFLNAESDRGIIETFDQVICTRTDGNRLQVWVRDWNDQCTRELNEKLNLHANGTGTRATPENMTLEELFMGMTS